MSRKATFFAIGLSAVIAYFSLAVWNIFFAIPPRPDIDEHAWWGRGEPNFDGQITPFTINVSDSVLQDLRIRLSNPVEFQPPLEGIQQQYGINTNHLRNIIEFWLTKYDWRRREKTLNKFPHFTVNIQGLKIHYLHMKPKQTKGLKVVPLLLLHGWPSSVREFFDLLPILTSPQRGKKFVFEVIAPSLPGFAFSEATVRPGLGPMEMAVIFKNLMSRLGFQKYYLQGGDWGGNLVQLIATLFPEKVLGIHSNFCLVNTPLSQLKLFLGSYFPSLIVSEDVKDKVYPLTEKYLKLLKESGYMHIQATKPDTLGVALRDSPVGLVAYMLEKYPLWTNPNWVNLEDGGLTKKFKLEDLLDNVMIYWTTGCITTSMRIYTEAFTTTTDLRKVSRIPIIVPSGCARFNYELVTQPEWVLKDKFANLIHVSDLIGGHFAPAEVPETLAKDLYMFVEKVENLSKT